MRFVDPLNWKISVGEHGVSVLGAAETIRRFRVRVPRRRTERALLKYGARLERARSKAQGFIVAELEDRRWREQQAEPIELIVDTISPACLRCGHAEWCHSGWGCDGGASFKCVCRAYERAVANDSLEADVG
jgi:hypothetical protein